MFGVITLKLVCKNALLVENLLKATLPVLRANEVDHGVVDARCERLLGTRKPEQLFMFIQVFPRPIPATLG